MKLYLLTATIFFSIAVVLLGFGVPYTISHIHAVGNVYCCSVNPLNGNTQSDTMYFEPLFEQATLFGILASTVGGAMLIVHVANKRAIENKT